jgi:3-isopropylmalate/(R)-2-methylmalate dehydratase large subunit
MKPGCKTLFDKVWDDHVVYEESGFPSVLYIDFHLIHEVTSPQAFAGLREKGLYVRRPEKMLATMDHSTPTLPLDKSDIDPQCEAQLKQLERNCQEFDIPLYQLGSDKRGIVHVISPELGMTQPGMTIVCGDSHTSTHGAFGTLAFGIGTSEVEHVLITQCLLQQKPRSMEIRVNGKMGLGVTAKDIILAIITKIGVNGGKGYAVEYTGEAIRALDMEARMTVCNMTIEAGARTGMIAPDDTTYEFLAGREFTPKGEAWEKALNRWRQLATDEDSTFDAQVKLDISNLEPMITFGTNPGMAVGITEPVPDPNQVSDPVEKSSLEKALGYMDLEPGRSLLDHEIDVVFIGSCTNSRISDLRLAASLLNGRKVSENVRVIVVPGSENIKKQAETEGLDQQFLQAGAEWREPGCSMCIGMNGDHLEPGQYAVSTSNRNFEGRQGKGGRTFLASPLTATAAAITGRISDPRILMSSRSVR